MGFHYVDYIIFVLFLAISLSIGLYHAFRGKQKTTEEFLMGNRKFHVLPVAISITLSFISAVLVLGQPAEVYTRGTQFSMVVIGQAAGSIFALLFIVPILFNLKVTSSFEYLERRYDSKLVKLVGSIAMLLCTILQLGIVLYAPSVALEAVTGIPTWLSITMSSIIAIIYTTLGGMKAVIWTDVFQGSCVLIGMIAVVVQGTLKVGGPSEVWKRNEANNRLEFFNMDPDPTVRTTLWSAFVSGVFVCLAFFGVGQTTVQRYCALPSLSKARWSLFINTCLLTFIVGLATVVGMVIFAYYDAIGCDPVRAKLITSPNQLLPYFVMDVLNFPGLPGLFISVLYGGALSTMSSSLNSASAVTWQDMLSKHFVHLQESRRTMITKILVAIYGAITVGMAFLAKYLGSHVLQAVNVVIGTFTGPVLGMFLLGMFFKFGNSKGAVVGCISGTVITGWIAVASLVTNQHSETLPTSIEFCNINNTVTFPPDTSPSNFTLNTTVAYDVTGLEGSTIGKFGYINSRTNDLSALFTLYSISYLLYPLIGFLISLIVGIVVSIATGGLKQKCVDSDLLAYKVVKKNFFTGNEDTKENQLPIELITFKECNGHFTHPPPRQYQAMMKEFYDIPLN